jgi:ParB family chromosome partitioning protein
MGDIIEAPRQVDIEAMAPPRAMLVDLASIAAASDNLRRAAAGPDADAQLLESIRSSGILHPILVRPAADPNRYIAIDGHRRLGAARTLGLRQVPALIRAASDAEQLAVQAASNVVRAPLADIDQWRAIIALQERGYSLADAAHTLGLPERRIRQLDKLGRLHPKILADIEANGMPALRTLTIVAAAPIKLQAAALKAEVWHRNGKSARLIWDELEEACSLQRIPRARAIFDVDQVKIVFEEDLFAQPDTEDAVTTTDVGGFLKAQRSALDTLAAASRGKIVVAEWNRLHGRPIIPNGWEPHYHGARPKGLVSYRCVIPEGYHVGKIAEVNATPKPKPSEASQPAGAPTADDEGFAPAQQPATGRGPITSKGREMIAAAQTQAIRQRIRDIAEATEEGELLEILLLCLCANNLNVQGNPATKYSSTSFDDLAAELLDDKAEQRELAPLTTRRIAGEAIARILIATPPGGHGSGDAAQWVGRWIEAGRAMPRLDTPEFLATLSHDALRVIAQDLDRPSSGTAKVLRDSLAGHAEHMRLPEPLWTAPGPTPSTRHDAEEMSV